MSRSATIDLRRATVRLRFTQGDAVTIPVTHREAGVPVDATVRDYRAQIRRGDLVVDFTIDNTGGDGLVVYSLAADDTMDLSGSYQWEIEDVTGGRTLLGGSVDVDPQVARP